MHKKCSGIINEISPIPYMTSITLAANKIIVFSKLNSPILCLNLREDSINAIKNQKMPKASNL